MDKGVFSKPINDFERDGETLYISPVFKTFAGGTIDRFGAAVVGPSLPFGDERYALLSTQGNS